MMNTKTLLTRKRNRNDSNTNSNPLKNINPNTQMVQFNGFNIIELYYTESIENNFISTKTQIQKKNTIELKEPIMNISELGENNAEIKEMIRTKAKNIEEYYTSKFGNCSIKENCFKCLMTDFFSNELLYFNSRKDLFNYCKYCILTKSKNLFTDENIFKENKEHFFKVNASFLNGWRFFIPKTICKGCFMEIINMKNLISNIKNIFSDTDKNSLCKTNYRNYALFSPRFRAAFSLKNKPKHIKRQSRSMIRTNNIKLDNTSNDNNNNSDIINLKKNENIKTKKDIKIKQKEKDNEKEKIYNLGVKIDKSKSKVSIIIDKKILDKSVIEELDKYLLKNYNKNNCKNIISNNKESYKEKDRKNKNAEKSGQNININIKKDISFNEDEFSNNIKNITFKGKNNISIINNININNNQIKLNTNFIELIYNQLKELYKDMEDNFLKYFNSLYQMRRDIILIVDNISSIFTNNVIFSINLQLLKNTQIFRNCLIFYKNFEKEKKIYEINFRNLKNSIEKMNNFLNKSSNEIKKSIENNNEKDEMIELIKNLKLFIDENKIYLDKFNEPFNNFIHNYNFFILLN